MAPVLNDFDGGKSITWAIRRAVGMALASLLAISRPTPSNGPSNGPRHINNKYINSYPVLHNKIIL
jgi:hypothetical protein